MHSRTVGVAAVLALAMTLPAGAAAAEQSRTYGLAFCNPQFFTVPANVTFVRVEAHGGHGGQQKHTAAGGGPGAVEAWIPVTPGEDLRIDVGQFGWTGGGCGWPRGGSRGEAGGGDIIGHDAFGGGGATAVRRYPDISQVLVVAGGGGGGGGDSGMDGRYGGPGGTGGHPAGAGQGGGDDADGGCGGCEGGGGGGGGHDQSTGAGGGGGGGGGGYPYGGGGGETDFSAGGGGGGGGTSFAAPGSQGVSYFPSPRSCPYHGDWDISYVATCDGAVVISWDITPAAITVAGGSAQQAPISSPFPQRLRAKVVNAEHRPVAGQHVTFTLPESGPSGTFGSGGSRTATATTNSDGIATSPVVDAGPRAGRWTAEARTEGVSSAARFAMTNLKAETWTSVSSSANPSVAGQQVRFTATVHADVLSRQANPTGTVRFLLDGVPIVNPGNPNDPGDTNFPLDASGTAVSAPVELDVGDHTMVVEYAGDANHDESQSPPLTQHVNRARTATTVSSWIDDGGTPKPGNPSTTGEDVYLEATVQRQAPAAGAPTGTVDFLVDDEVVVADVPLVDGVARTPDAPAFPNRDPFDQDGDYRIEAVYSGDADDLESTGSMVQSVGDEVTATSVATSVNPAIFGEPFTLTATVHRQTPGEPPRGTATFTIADEEVCAATPLTGGQATCTVEQPLPPAPYVVQVDFDGTGTGFDSSFGTMVQQVVPSSSSTSAAVAPEPSTFGDSTRATAHVAGAAKAGAEAGTVQFLVDGEAFGDPVEVRNGAATSEPIPAALLRVGLHRVEADYQDDGNRVLPSRGATVHRVVRAPTALTLSSSADPSQRGAPFTLTAEVSAPGAAGKPIGTVYFLADGATLGGPALVRDGRAVSAPIDDLPAGVHEITAHYDGGVEFEPSDGTLTQRVEEPPPAPPAPPPPSGGGGAAGGGPAPPPAPPSPPAGPTARRANASVPTFRVHVGLNGRAALSLRCTGPAGRRCAGRLQLRSARWLPARLVTGRRRRGTRPAGVLLGSRSYSVPAGRTVRLRVPLNAVGRRVLSARAGIVAHTRLRARRGSTATSRRVMLLGARAPAAWAVSRSLVRTRSGRPALRVRCGASRGRRCRGRLVLRTRGGRLLGRGAVSVPGRSTRVVRIRLTASGRTRVRGARSAARATVRTTVRVGRATSRRRTIAIGAR